MQHVSEVASITVPEGRAYLVGCERCTYGRIHAVPMDECTKRYPNANNLPELLLMAFRDGLFTFCECDAGQVSARMIEKAAEDLATSEVAMKAIVARSAQARLDRVFSDAQVPRRFAELTWAGYKALAAGDPGKDMAIKAIDAYIAKNRVNTNRGMREGIMLYGKSDMGKTGALSPLFLRYILQGLPGLWVQYNDLLAALRNFESGQVEDRISACKYAQYLFIDDFGDPAAEKAATDYTRDVIFRIIDYRNNVQAPTFITTNLDPGKLTGQFHERIVKRLAELCVMVEVSGTPMRELMDEKRAVSKWDGYPTYEPLE